MGSERQELRDVIFRDHIYSRMVESWSSDANLVEANFWEILNALFLSSPDVQAWWDGLSEIEKGQIFERALEIGIKPSKEGR